MPALRGLHPSRLCLLQTQGNALDACHLQLGMLEHPSTPDDQTMKKELMALRRDLLALGVAGKNEWAVPAWLKQ
jgi:hypothetical protein